MIKKNKVAAKGKEVSVQEYTQVLSELRKRIREAQMQAIMAVNTEFFTPRNDYVERDVEHGLVDNIQKCLLELGSVEFLS